MHLCCVCMFMHLRGIERGWVHGFHYFSRVHDLRNINSKPLLLRENYLNKTLEGKDVKSLPLKQICCSIDSSPAFG